MQPPLQRAHRDGRQGPTAAYERCQAGLSAMLYPLREQHRQQVCHGKLAAGAQDGSGAVRESPRSEAESPILMSSGEVRKGLP